ncbi:hypothetical protein EIP86_011131 [Pleurotus ostreatoroseus]|nr:hypothetical protein EIP86_011131 [Pleurotus ostreatoroseus]
MSHPSLSDDYGFSLLLKAAEFMDGNSNIDHMWNWIQAPIETSAPVDHLPPTQPVSPDALTSPAIIPPPLSTTPTSLSVTATGGYMTRRRSKMVNNLDDIPRETVDAKQSETRPARARPSKPRRRGSRVDHGLDNTPAETDVAREPSSGPSRTSSTKPRDGSRASSSANNRKANPVKGRERWHCYFAGCTATIYPRKHDIDRHIQVHLNPEE